MRNKLGENELSDIAKKTYDGILNNLEHYDEIMQKKYEESKQIFGKNYHENYFLPNDFSFDAQLTEDLFLKRKFKKEGCDEPLLSNSMFYKFQHMKKQPVNSFYQFQNKENKVIGQYLANKNKNDQITLFAFTMVQNNNNENDFTLKLDMCYQGKKWINICRFDSDTEWHPNYFTKNEIFADKSDIEIISGPHMHYNSITCEILGKDKHDYLPAYDIENEELIKNGDSLFVGSLKYFAKETGLDECINISTFTENKSTKQNFFENPLFLYDNQDELTY